MFDQSLVVVGLVVLLTQCSLATDLDAERVPMTVEIPIPAPTGRTCEHTQLTNFLLRIQELAPQLVRMTSLGKSIQGREIWTMVLSDDPYMRPLLRPQVKFVGNINGVSGPACFTILKLIEYLVKGYLQGGSLQRKFLTSTEIHVVPNMNPDGYAKSISGSCKSGYGRLNANGVTLNRDFPDVFYPEEMGRQREPETEIIMKWMEQNYFVISASLISGAWVVTYPFDSVPYDEHGPPISGTAHLTPDADIFDHLASTYVRNLKPGAEIGRCPSLRREFEHGMINGAAWSHAKGTMQDYNYVHGTFEMLIGIACCRNENKTELLDLIWEDNKDGLISLIEQANMGLRGQVLDAMTLLPLRDVEIIRKSQQYMDPHDDAMPWYTGHKGEFWRPLLPGKYVLEVKKEGYHSTSIPFQVDFHQPTELTIQLKKIHVFAVEPPPIDIASNAEPATHITDRQEFYDQILSQLDYTESIINESPNEDADAESISLESDYAEVVNSLQESDQKHASFAASSISFTEQVSNSNFSRITSLGSKQIISVSFWPLCFLSFVLGKFNL